VPRDRLFTELELAALTPCHRAWVQRRYLRTRAWVKGESATAGFLEETRGVLQGDPLSPNLFIFYVRELPAGDAEGGGARAGRGGAGGRGGGIPPLGGRHHHPSPIDSGSTARAATPSRPTPRRASR